MRISAGVLLLLLGVAGLVLPFLQGIAMIVGGLTLLAVDVPWARRLLHRLRERAAAARARIREARAARREQARRRVEERDEL